MPNLNKLHKNFFIFVIIIFLFIPLNFIPQLFDGVLLSYAHESGNKNLFLEAHYKDTGRYFHLLFVNSIFHLSNYTHIPLELLFDNILIIFLILVCFEVKKYSNLLFKLNERWSNFAALSVAIFPVWHTLVDFDIGLYLISIYLVLFGFRKFISSKLNNIIFGVCMIIFSFNLESNMSFVIGLALVYFLLSRSNKKFDMSYFKFLMLILLCFSYYFIKDFYFPASGAEEGYQKVTFDKLNSNLMITKIANNILRFSSFLLFNLWIPAVCFLMIFFKNNKNLLKFKPKIKLTNNYFLLILLSAFAIFPYLIVNKSSTIIDVTDYYQRHAFLLAPIFGIFFANIFKDIEKINILKIKVNLNSYIICFIILNLIILSFGNYKKTESYLVRKNLTNELKSYNPIAKGNVQFLGTNIPYVFRPFELNHVLYNSFGQTSWFSTPFHIKEMIKPSSDKDYFSSKQLTYRISSEYKGECNIYIYLKDDLTNIHRIKKFYIFNYKKYYNIDKIIEKC